MHKNFFRRATILLGIILVGLGNLNDALGMKEEEGPYTSKFWNKQVTHKTKEAKLLWDSKAAFQDWATKNKYTNSLNNNNPKDEPRRQEAARWEQESQQRLWKAESDLLKYSKWKSENPRPNSPRLSKEDIQELEEKFKELSK